ncbi:MAG TPA: transposase [Solimonas sp.]|nr:transposase [Solimonas sp.]
MKKCNYSRDQILQILREVDEGQSPSVVATCERHGVSRQAFYYWRAKYGPVSRDAVRLQQLESETQTLRQQLARHAEMLAGLQQRLQLAA